MKVNPLTSAIQAFSRIRERGDAGDQPQKDRKKGGQDQNAGQEEGQDEFQDPREMEEKLRTALEAFRHDKETQATGLQVDSVGHGPGLTVTLKDVQGKVLRQFTGAEFLKLRESSKMDTHHRGKLLDRKL